jgi:hypothetical protein
MEIVSVFAARTVDLKDRVVDAINTHAAKRQRVSRRSFIAVVWGRGKDKVVFAQYAFAVTGVHNGTQKHIEEGRVHCAGRPEENWDVPESLTPNTVFHAASADCAVVFQLALGQTATSR